jgi:hypothetical protein
MDTNAPLLLGRRPDAVDRLLNVFQSSGPRLVRQSVTTVTAVLDVIRQPLEAEGWICATGRRAEHGVAVAATTRRVVRADATHPSGAALWIELGRAWTNNAALMHLVEAALAPEVAHIVLAVRARYNGQPTLEHCRDLLLDIDAANLGLTGVSTTLIGF